MRLHVVMRYPDRDKLTRSMEANEEATNEATKQERMTIGERPLDLHLLLDASDLLGRSFDRARVLAFIELDEETTLAAIAGLANGSGGHLLVGVEIEPDGETIQGAPGVDAAGSEALLGELVLRLDPPLDEPPRVRRLPVGAGRHLLIVSVRQSPRPPHIDTISGRIHLHAPGGPSTVHTRHGLDLLYAKGRAERERAERLIEAMSERLMLAQHAYYGLGIIACLQQPTADAYLWAREHPEELALAEDPFVAAWEFTPAMAKIRPAEVELRNEREVCGLVRVARSGCLAIGETRRRPPGDVIGSREELSERLQMMIDCTCRILAHAEATLIVPRLFCEGLKGTHIVLDRRPYRESPPSGLDAVQSPAPTGDAADPAYRGELHALFLEQLCRPFLRGIADGA